ncbi:MAG: DUF3810 domain-containing protein, partial [Flavobacteriaceae bacterium]|nr:DUF3810 domain-containing protein [Flavobacteriaceae bacterium]
MQKFFKKVLINKALGLKLMAACLPLQILGLWIISCFPNIVEAWYSLKIYPLISRFHEWSFGLLPFSFGDFIYTGLTLYVLGFMIVRFKNKVFFRLKTFWTILASISVALAYFQLSWGLNYYRSKLSDTLSVNPKYSKNQLFETLDFFIENTNELHKTLVQHDRVLVDFSIYSSKENFASLNKTLNALYAQHHFDFLPKPAYFSVVKSSIYQVSMQYTGVSGFFNPITHETHYNRDILFYKLPVLLLHEKAHKAGFAAENEANFVGISLGLASEDAYVQYSASAFALRYLLGNVYRNFPDDYEDFYCKIRPGVLKNYQELNEYWKAFEGPIEKQWEKVYDSYLKANNQSKGIESYSY